MKISWDSCSMIKNAQDSIDMLLAEFANVDAWSLATLPPKPSLGSMIVVLA